MLQHLRKPFVAFSALAAVLAMTGCQGNGGGTLASACATTGTVASKPGLANVPATFGFAFQGPDLLSNAGVSFSGTYRDACAGVALRGDGLLKPLDPAQGPPLGVQTPNIFGCDLSFPVSFFGGSTTYVSTNPANQGTGTMQVFVCDGGVRGGLSPEDTVYISVTSGPFKDYTNFGTVQNGNIVSFAQR